MARLPVRILHRLDELVLFRHAAPPGRQKRDRVQQRSVSRNPQKEPAGADADDRVVLPDGESDQSAHIADAFALAVGPGHVHAVQGDAAAASSPVPASGQAACSHDAQQLPLLRIDAADPEASSVLRQGRRVRDLRHGKVRPRRGVEELDLSLGRKAVHDSEHIPDRAADADVGELPRTAARTAVAPYRPPLRVEVVHGVGEPVDDEDGTVGPHEYLDRLAKEDVVGLLQHHAVLEDQRRAGELGGGPGRLGGERHGGDSGRDGQQRPRERCSAPAKQSVQ